MCIMFYGEPNKFNDNDIISKQPQGGRKKMFYFAPHLTDSHNIEDLDPGPKMPGGPRIDWPKYWHHGVIPFFIDPKTYGKYNYHLILSICSSLYNMNLYIKI